MKFHTEFAGGNYVYGTVGDPREKGKVNRGVQGVVRYKQWQSARRCVGRVYEVNV
jgi:hypothetical protein